ncbi:MAG: excinuclease ABC subunit UvrC [Gammaproteobacteria bacterium]|nr:excinuclease ABC subunit UvrC [Gammaproteobacteria bacterium]
MSPSNHRRLVQTLAARPGVYRMLDSNGELLYVGKAKNLKKRVAAYFSRSQQSLRISKMLAQTERIETTVTNTESEALLLENNLIKRHRPRYNILLKDDKSYPYIFISTSHAFPQIAFYRGSHAKTGKYFGPYASAGAAREALSILQKVFKVRQCDDYFFNHRDRPCLQYQIDRCSAPCVGLIDSDSYCREVLAAVEFLNGNSDFLIASYIEKMDHASTDLDYEKAAQYRDKIELLRAVSEQQYISSQKGDVDIVAVALEGQVACVQIFNIRAGVNLGNKCFFPKLPGVMREEEVIAAFIGQYYLTHSVPEEIFVGHRPSDAKILQEVLSNKLGKSVSIVCSPRSKRARWLDIAKKNAAAGLHGKMASKAGFMQRFEAIQEELGLDCIPVRIECFDVSHISGEATVASCVVFEQEGPVKSDYRCFHIRGTKSCDDYAAMHQALTRHYTRLKQVDGKLPDILLIDGGKGQVGEASAVLNELQVENVTIIGVTKVAGRRTGGESLVFADTGKVVHLPENSLALHLIQQIRNEAHRFAITGHRKRRARNKTTSPLEHIAGVGPKRRQNLLKHFGGMRGINRAGVEELAKVPGISLGLAEAVYQKVHESSN